LEERLGRSEKLHQLRARKGVERLAPDRMELDEAAIAQAREMSRDGRLREAELVDEVRYARLSVAKPPKNGQAAGVGEAPKE
jgi:hypothetical protein